MSHSLQFLPSPEGALTVGLAADQPLWTYNYVSAAPATESPRPFIHPLCSLDGDVLTNVRPNDHPWHHAVSFMLTSLDGVNFWGGPSYRREDSYQWREDQGCQHHVAWIERSPHRLVERLDWRRSAASDEVVVSEERELRTDWTEEAWSLTWISRLTNPHDRDLVSHNYHSLGGLEGSHYSGLQFRGARGLLDEHGDDRIGMEGEGGVIEPMALHGREATWLEWHTQTDTSLNRQVIRFESLSGPIPWFVRPENPLVAFAPHQELSMVLAAGQSREFHHRITIRRA